MYEAGCHVLARDTNYIMFFSPTYKSMPCTFHHLTYMWN